MNLNEPKVYHQEMVVLQEHLDEMNHVNNVQYLKWIQDIAKAHWDEEATTTWLEQYAWVALSHFIEYKKPAFLSNQLLIQTHVHEFSGPKCNRLVRIHNNQTKDLLVQSSTWWCMLDKSSGKPVRVLPEMVLAFSKR